MTCSWMTSPMCDRHMRFASAYLGLTPTSGSVTGRLGLVVWLSVSSSDLFSFFSSRLSTTLCYLYRSYIGSDLYEQAIKYMSAATTNSSLVWFYSFIHDLV